MKQALSCDWCGKTIERYSCQIKAHNFCSRGCAAAFSYKSQNPKGYNELRDYTGMSENMSNPNRRMNPTRMTKTVRAKIRESHLRLGQSKSYVKFFGVHEHRVVAEQMLGRPLRKGEIVHHVDRNKRNNVPENLMIFNNQAEHAAWHAKHDRGDAK